VVRSPRTQHALLVAFAALVVAGGAAFASTATAQLAWQKHDTIDVHATGFELVDGDEPTLRVEFAATNPTAVDARLRVAALVAYDGEVRSGEGLTVPRSERLAGDRERSVPAGERVTMTLVADVPPERVERTREAVDADRIEVSGSFGVSVRGRSDTLDV